MTRSAGAPAAVSIRIIAEFVALGDHPAERVAVDAGEVAVQDDDVVGVEVELRGGVEAVVGDVDGHALVAQAFGDRVGELRESSTTRTLTSCAPGVAERLEG